jgi:rare lipoprotein A
MNKFVLLIASLGLLSACAEIELGSHLVKKLTPSDSKTVPVKVGYFKTGSPYKIKGRYYTPKETYNGSETGIASWYGPGFHGKMTANGEIFNRYELTAAHRTLQMPSIVRVTNLSNGKSIIVRVNDRGPFAHDRIIDLSDKAAEILDMKHKGTARVRVDVLEKPSRQVASAARAGKSTRGAEIALNRGLSLDRDMPLQIAEPVRKPYSSAPVVKQAELKPQSRMFDDIIVKQVNAAEPVRKPRQILPTVEDNVFVQAGVFENEDNAMTMKMALYNMSEPVSIHRADIGGVNMYRVKIGPVNSKIKANEIVSNLQKQGRDAKIVTADR